MFIFVELKGCREDLIVYIKCRNYVGIFISRWIIKINRWRVRLSLIRLKKREFLGYVVNNCKVEIMFFDFFCLLLIFYWV